MTCEQDLLASMLALAARLGPWLLVPAAPALLLSALEFRVGERVELRGPVWAAVLLPAALSQAAFFWRAALGPLPCPLEAWSAASGVGLVTTAVLAFGAMAATRRARRQRKPLVQDPRARSAG